MTHKETHMQASIESAKLNKKPAKPQPKTEFKDLTEYIRYKEDNNPILRAAKRREKI